jgi:MFS family permease
LLKAGGRRIVDQVFTDVGYYDAVQNKENSSHHTIKNILTHDFVFGFLGLFVFIVAYHALFPTLPIFLARLGSDEREIGVLVGVFGGSSLIFRLIVGSILLKYSEKSVMMSGALLFALTFLASIVLRPFWPFFAVRFFQGVAFAFTDTAALAFIVKVTPTANRGRAISYFVLAPPFSQAIAPSLGMFLINQYNFTVLFLFCVGLSLCAFFFSWKLKGQNVIAPDNEIPEKNNFFVERRIVAPSIMNFMQNFVWGGIIAFLPLYAINCGVTNPGWFFTANATMLIAGRALGGKILDTYNKEKIIRIFIFTSMITMVILAFSTTLPMFILVGLLWGTGGGFFFPASMAYALDYAGSSAGPAVGTFRALSDLGLALGPTLAGLIIPFTGYQVMFLCLALVSLINLSYFQFYVRKKGYVQI